MNPSDFLALIQPESAFAPFKPGFFRLPEKTYRAAPGESQTALKPLLQSAKHYEYARAHPFKGSDYSRFGTLIHGLYLEGWSQEIRAEDALRACNELMKEAAEGEAEASFPEPSTEEAGDDGIPVPDARKGLALYSRILGGLAPEEAYCAIPSAIKRNTKAGKQAYADLCEANKGRIMLKRMTADRVEKWATAATEALKGLRSDAGLEVMMAHSPPECRELAWFCEIDGVFCKGLLDTLAIIPSGIVLLDLKATTDASEEAWKYKVRDMDYDVQAALYSKAVKILAGLDYEPPWAWIVVESVGPWCHQLIGPPDEMMQMGWEKVLRSLELLKRCRESKQWPGYAPGLKVLNLKPWELRSWQDLESA